MSYPALVHPGESEVPAGHPPARADQLRRGRCALPGHRCIDEREVRSLPWEMGPSGPDPHFRNESGEPASMLILFAPGGGSPAWTRW